MTKTAMFRRGKWLGEAGRGDSLFSWEDLRVAQAEPDPMKSVATKRIRDWARLLAAVGINAIAPQDVNWCEKTLSFVCVCRFLIRERSFAKTGSG